VVSRGVVRTVGALVHPLFVVRMPAERDLEALAQQVVELDQPGEVMRAAGAWLSAALSAEGFGWLRSLGTLQRKDRGRLEQVHLQNSKWNRSGELIEFSSIVNVRDRVLKEWRQAHPHQAVRLGDDWVCGHQFGDVVGFVGNVDLTSADRRIKALENYVDRVRTVAIPWFAASSDPTTLVEAVPGLTLEPFAAELLEWLVSRNQEAPLRPLIERWLGLNAVHPAEFEAGRERALRGEGPPGAYSRQSLGWSCVMLGIR
jgi:hypothetical protein